MLPDIGSDHSPILVEFSCEPERALLQEEPKADREEREEAEEIIAVGKTVGPMRAFRTH